MCVTLPAKNLRLRLWRRVPQHARQSQDRSNCGGQCHTPDRARLKETLTDNRFCCLSPPVHIGLQAKTNLLSMNPKPPTIVGTWRDIVCIYRSQFSLQLFGAAQNQKRTAQCLPSCGCPCPVGQQELQHCVASPSVSRVPVGVTCGCHP